MYKLLRSILFCFDPENVHYFSMNILKRLCGIGFIRRLITLSFTDQSNMTGIRLFGLNFKNPVGLAAGFDKNAKWLRELEALGFGCVEIGTVTPLPQQGNDKPRLFRLPKDKALVNRMGFNNEGVELVKQRLKVWRTTGRVPQSSLIIGGKIGKNKLTPNEDAWMDYEKCFRGLFEYVDYFVVNVSSPNTPGLRELQEKESLRKILVHLQNLNKEFPMPKPILLKIAPDLSTAQVDDVIFLALEIHLDGLVATNTTISREGLNTPQLVLDKIGAGGLSGMPLKDRSTGMVNYICEKTRDRIPVIASGGIFTALDAKEKMMAGACLVQVWTGFIYKGPSIAKNLCRGLYSASGKTIS